MCECDADWLPRSPRNLARDGFHKDRRAKPPARLGTGHWLLAQAAKGEIVLAEAGRGEGRGLRDLPPLFP